MHERNWRAVEAEKALIWTWHAYTNSKSFRKFELRLEKFLPSGKKDPWQEEPAAAGSH